MTQSPVLEDQWRLLFLFWGLGATCFRHTAEFSFLRLAHPASPDSAPASSTWVTQCHIYVKAELSDLCDSLVIPETGSYLLTYSLWLPSTPLGHSLSQCSHIQGHLMWGNNTANLRAPRITHLSESTPNPHTCLPDQDEDVSLSITSPAYRRAGHWQQQCTGNLTRF